MSPILDDTATRQLAAVAEDIAQRTHGGLVTSVVAPGGYGKTTLLTHLAAVTGGTVVAPPFDAATADVLLVDDAQLLDDVDLAVLRALVTENAVRLVVAARPWPASAGLTALLELATEALLPAPFDAAQVRAFLPAPLADPARVEFVHAQTGGVPAFVDRLSRAMHGHQELSVPASALAEFRPEFARLDPDVLRYLLAADAGVGLHLDLLVDLLDADADAVGDTVTAARSTGLVGAAGTLQPIARRALRALVPVERRVWIRQRLAELQLARGGQVLALVRPLVGAGVGGAGTAIAFEAAAAEAMPADPALAASLYAAAVGAGRPATAVGARRAEALALAGDLDGALRVADAVLTDESAPGREVAAGVAAAAFAHRGQPRRSAALYRWSGTADHFAAIGLVGVGEAAEASALLDKSTSDTPPTSLSSAIALMAQGLYESVTGTPTTALSMLVRSAGLLEPVGAGVLLPDSPAALGALLALHYGELATATSLLDRAVAAGMGGAPLASRHRLLQAWLAMVRGNLTQATEMLTAVRKATVEPRDWLFALAIELGVARRAGETAALGRAWQQAGEAVLRQPVDLFTVLPLGELAMAAARLRDLARLETHLAQAKELLGRLGNPPLWAVPLWWAGLHAALTAEDHDAAEEHGTALAKAAANDATFATIAGAARCWLELSAGRVDPDAVEEAARSLHAAGFVWDGARLAGRAATRTTDRKAMVRLLDCARMLQGKPVARRTVAQPSTSDILETDAVDVPTGINLSEREVQVAELVVAGLTYKDVGDRLFISAKTVEHHVARMRQRLGATSRSDLLAQLRGLVGGSPDVRG